MDCTALLSKEFGIAPPLVENIIALIDEGNTIPFIARYRKERTGSCDDQTLRALADRLAYLRGLQKRREEVLSAIGEQGKLTESLAADIAAAETLARLEDIYRPYKQKRRTRATVARERGLEPLAQLLLAQDQTSGSVEALAAPYASAEKDVPTAADAISGACDIIAEQISDSAEGRARLRDYYWRNARLCSTAVDSDKESVYTMYYEYA